MKNFIDKRTGETKQAFSLREENEKVYVQFTETGKEYSYMKSNIEILEKNDERTLFIYSFNQTCYACGKETEILTYMIFGDEIGGNLTYPWDKNRLHNSQTTELLLAHMADESIEYYPIAIIGSADDLDKIMLSEFKERIAMRYSSTQKRKYAMNLCLHCGIKQGEYYIYKHLNKVIQKMGKLTVFKQLSI